MSTVRIAWTMCVAALALAATPGCNSKAEPVKAGATEATSAAAVETTEDRADAGTAAKHDAGDTAAQRDAGTDRPRAGVAAPAAGPTTGEDAMEALAEALAERVRALDLRERDLIQREQMLERLEAAALMNEQELRKLHDETASMLAKLQGRRENVREGKTGALTAEEREVRIGQLVATIKGMRAASGAGLLASLPTGDAITVLQRMGSRLTAEMLGAMDPDKAASMARAMIGESPASGRDGQADGGVR
ncbi:MAG: hypothetical protein PHU25_10265 [Deltaproteobacteria bacterium]|nr:hypothetical protein [Deltaproteobacteria bacterium]